MKHSDRESVTSDPVSQGGAGNAWGGLPGRAVRDMAFFVLFYVFLWRMVEPHLIFHGAGLITNFPSFYTTWGFFTEHLSAPGGPVEYLSALLSQGFYYSWLGALIVTIQAWLLGLCTGYLLKACGFTYGRPVRFAPALLLTVLYGQYTYFVPTTMALLVALLCACVYTAVARRKALIGSLTIFALLSAACYYAAGGAFLLFALIGAIYELTFTDRWQLGLGYVAVALGLPVVVGGLGFGQVEVYSELLPISWKLLHYLPRTRWIELVYALYLLVPAVMLAGGLWPLLASFRPGRKANVPAKHRKHAAGKKASSPVRALAWYRQSPKLDWAARTVVLIGILSGVAFGGLDRQRKNWFAVDHYAAQGMWAEAIATGRHQMNDPFVMHVVNRALYHTGRLSEDLFDWPQRPAFLFLSDISIKQVYWTTFSLYLEMGLINAAEHALTECLEGIGERPVILKSLALVNLVKGNRGTARVYLNRLHQTFFERDWAGRYLDLLNSDPNLATDRQVQQLRSVALERDFTAASPPTPEMLEALLEKNPKNRMAFEYMMVAYLLNKRLAMFVQHIEQCQEVGYTTLPTCFEEAALAYVYGTRKSLYLGDYEPRDELRRRTEGFLKILKRHKGDKRAALVELLSQYRNTYMFYHVYAPAGDTK